MTSVFTHPDLDALIRGIAHGASAAAVAAPGAAASVEPAAQAPMQQVVLCRSGMQPMRFEGMLMVEQASASDDGQRRHVVRLFETAADTLVIAIALEWPGGDRLAHVVVDEVADVEGAESFLLSYDAGRQAALGRAEASVDIDPVAAQAIALSAEARRLRHDFSTVCAGLFAAFGDLNTPSRRTN
jgi:hypothetical protein